MIGAIADGELTLGAGTWEGDCAITTGVAGVIVLAVTVDTEVLDCVAVLLVADSGSATTPVTVSTTW